MTAAAPRRAALAAGGVLAAVYIATMAPGVTLWDAGEFASAVESLGIPHPPGTPLYILIARTWRLAFGVLDTVVATSLFAAVSTAVAAAIGAALVTRWMRDTAAGIAAGLTFGGLSTVWSSATETEVYSASLLLSMLMLLVADRTSSAHCHPPSLTSRGDRLLAYLFALAPSLHLSAMVAAPGAIALASVDDRMTIDAGRATLLVGAAVLAVGVGTAAPGIAVAGIVLLAARAVWLRSARDAAGVVVLTAIAASAFLFMVVRARHDPMVNQGNPATIAGVVDVMARRQYDVPGLWPRRAPLWLQIGNLIQYTDWQFALGLDRSVGPSWRRTVFTPLFMALGVAGSLAHRKRDRRTWFATLALFAAATLGVVFYLNLRAGPSYGYGVLPPDADREARERDYFFALGFAVGGLWAGIGAVTLARRVAKSIGAGWATWAGVGLAALPLALNWRASDRRREPGASVPNAFARATLESAPPRAVLFVAGDNDTYPLWYAQVADSIRRDVTVVTVPLLGATWYRSELARRGGLYDPADIASWRGTRREIAGIARLAENAGRPVTASVALPADDRHALGAQWNFRGLVYVKVAAESGAVATSIDVPGVDSTAVSVARLFPGSPDPARVDDSAARYVVGLLACPGLARDAARGTAADSARLLASRCNFR